jgi:hypothetical protein
MSERVCRRGGWVVVVVASGHRLVSMPFTMPQTCSNCSRRASKTSNGESRRRCRAGCPGAPARCRARGGICTPESPGGVRDEPANHALGRSRGGLPTKLRLGCEQGAQTLSVVVTCPPPNLIDHNDADTRTADRVRRANCRGLTGNVIDTLLRARNIASLAMELVRKRRVIYVTGRQSIGPVVMLAGSC